MKLLGCLLLLAVAGPLMADEAAERAAVESITAGELHDVTSALADDTFEGREGGSRGGRAAAIYLVERLQRSVAKPGGPEGTYYQAFGRAYSNLLAIVEGSDPQLKDQWIVVGAHYDHVGYGSQSNSYGPIGYIHNGADDNASGTAGLLEVIEAMEHLPQRPKRSILFALWDGEEKGLLGSKYWTDYPTIPLRQVGLMINIDMIGRMRDARLEIAGTRTAAGLRRLASEPNRDTDLWLDFTWELKNNSDHYSFYSRQIPILMLHTGLHDDYHRPSDDVDRLNHQGLHNATRYLFKLVLAAGNAPNLAPFRPKATTESPWFQQAVERPLPPLPGRLGIRWDDGNVEHGLKVSSVAENSPAAKAGIRPGDRILEFAGRTFKNSNEFASLVLAAPSPATAVVERAGEEEPLTIEVRLSGKPVRLGITWREDPAEPGCVILTRVVPGSPAAIAGLRVNDRIYQIGGEDFADSEAFGRLASTLPGPLSVLMERSGRMREILVHLVEEIPQVAARGSQR